MSASRSKPLKVKFYTERSFGRMVKRWLGKQGVKFVTKNPDLIIVCYYPHIIPIEELTAPTINFHPGLLPINRGMYPHIWPLVDGSPAGVTIHYITEKVDAGPLIAQKRVPVFPTDIATDLEERTRKEIFNLFKKTWPNIKKGVKGIPQKGKSSYHPAREIATIQEFDKQTVNRLRACTFKDRSYGYFMENGKKIYIGIKFFKQSDIDKFARSNK